MITKKKVLWISRHTLDQDQYNDLVRILGDIHITHVNGTIPNVHVPFVGHEPEKGDIVCDDILVGKQIPLKDLVKDFDEVVGVLPIGIQNQILPHTPNNRVISCRSKRLQGDQGTIRFIFESWYEITKIEIVTKDL